MSSFDNAKRALLSLSRVVLFPAIVAMAIALLWIQLMELTGNKEILPLSSFVLLLSLSALGFNWCRTAPEHSSAAALVTACQSAIKLFVASLLALVSAGLAFVRESVSEIPNALTTPIFVLHWLFLALALALFLVAILSMLSHARMN